MYEVVKVVNNKAITKMQGTRGVYHVTVESGNGFTKFVTFNTIKAASAFCEAL